MHCGERLQTAPELFLFFFTKLLLVSKVSAVLKAVFLFRMLVSYFLFV